MVRPAPSQTVSKQSAGSSRATNAPCTALSVPHTPSVHVATTHALGGPGQSKARVHAAALPPTAESPAEFAPPYATEPPFVGAPALPALPAPLACPP